VAENIRHPPPDERARRRPLPNNSTAAIGKGMPDKIYPFPAEILADIDARAFAMAGECVPALRNYLLRKCSNEAVNGRGHMPSLLPQVLQHASLGDALAYELHGVTRHAESMLRVLQVIATDALDNIKAAHSNAKAALAAA
jgi:hypothetical protein